MMFFFDVLIGCELILNGFIYYFYIKFMNNVGKDVEIFIFGMKKINVIFFGKFFYFKFFKYKMEFVDFVVFF